MRYTEEQKLEWVLLAEQIGPYRAKKAKNYPAHVKDGIRWAVKLGIELPRNPLSQWANAVQVHVTASEKLAVAQLFLEAIAEALRGASASDIKHLSTSYREVIQSIQLQEGKATEIAEKYVDSVDWDKQAALLREQDQKNELMHES